ncbi:MAG: signal peptidase I [Deltaproteobacteria bacterium]|nr:signal peptidase I [Deltaproteobacteria bacterium]
MNKHKPPKSAFRDNMEAIIIALIIAFFIRSFVVQSYKIPSGSMKDTLLIGDHLLVSKFIYGVKLPFTDITLLPISKPKHGDVIVFKFPEDEKKDFIKRVVGIEGDTIEIRKKRLFVNNKPAEYKAAAFKNTNIIPPWRSPRDYFGPITVPKNSIFVMGDNRDHSYDSRFWGFVKLKKLRGKALVIFWSWDSENTRPRWNRIGKIIK